jgi:putative DNA primase/helicase
MKSIAGSDPITARHLHQEPIEFLPQCTIFIASNYRPSVPDDDDALWERLHEIPFTQQVPEAHRDPGLRRALREDRALRAAVLAWAVDGLRMLRAEGLNPPGSVRAATVAYRREMDPMEEFFEECCLLDTADPKLAVSAKRFRSAYLRWCELNGRRPLTSKQVGIRLRKRGCTRERRTVDGDRGWAWWGISILPEPNL